MHGQLHAVTVHRQSNLPELLGARGAEQQHTITQQPSGQGSRVRAHRQPRSTGRSCTVNRATPAHRQEAQGCSIFISSPRIQLYLELWKRLLAWD